MVLVLSGVQHDGFHSPDFLFIKLAGSLGDVDIGLLADDVGESSTNTLDGGHGDGDVTLTIDVGVLDTKDVLELVSATEGHFDSGPFLLDNRNRTQKWNLSALTSSSTSFVSRTPTSMVS